MVVMAPGWFVLLCCVCLVYCVLCIDRVSLCLSYVVIYAYCHFRFVMFLFSVGATNC